jgi:hypothetical protein
MRRHSFDPFSFLFGVVFLMIGVSFLLSPSGPQVATPFRLWPAAVVLVGLTLSAWAVARAIRPAAPAVATGEGPASADPAETDPGSGLDVEASFAPAPGARPSADHPEGPVPPAEA